MNGFLHRCRVEIGPHTITYGADLVNNIFLTVFIRSEGLSLVLTWGLRRLLLRRRIMPPDPFRGLGLHLLVASLLPLVSGQLGDWETTALCIHDSSCQLPYVTISTSFHLDANTRHTWIYLIVYFSTATRPEPALYMTFFFNTLPELAWKKYSCWALFILVHPVQYRKEKRQKSQLKALWHKEFDWTAPRAGLKPFFCAVPKIRSCPPKNILFSIPSWSCVHLQRRRGQQHDALPVPQELHGTTASPGGNVLSHPWATPSQRYDKNLVIGLTQSTVCLCGYDYDEKNTAGLVEELTPYDTFCTHTCCEVKHLFHVQCHHIRMINTGQTYLGHLRSPRKHRKNCECCPGHSLIVNH